MRPHVSHSTQSSLAHSSPSTASARSAITLFFRPVLLLSDLLPKNQASNVACNFVEVEPWLAILLHSWS